jgi:hypothetical protein
MVSGTEKLMRSVAVRDSKGIVRHVKQAGPAVKENGLELLKMAAKASSVKQKVFLGTAVFVGASISAIGLRRWKVRSGQSAAENELNDSVQAYYEAEEAGVLTVDVVSRFLEALDVVLTEADGKSVELSADAVQVLLWLAPDYNSKFVESHGGVEPSASSGLAPAIDLRNLLADQRDLMLNAM